MPTTYFHRRVKTQRAVKMHKIRYAVAAVHSTQENNGEISTRLQRNVHLPNKYSTTAYVCLKHPIKAQVDDTVAACGHNTNGNC